MIYFRKFNYDTIVNDASRHYKKWYSNIIFTFDIETTSVMVDPESGRAFLFDKSKPAAFYDDYEKCGYMYIWMFGINDTVIYGRTWDEFQEFLQILNGYVLGIKIIYVHNLSFEFQFLRNVFPEMEVFARSERHVIYAKIPDQAIEFRCSYLLTNMSLAAVTKGYNLPVNKKTGDLEYNRIRNSKTKLTRAEMGYCEYDIIVLYYLIKAHIAEYGQPYNIPYTQTGRVRRVCQDLYKGNRKYHDRLKEMLPKDIDQFTFILKAFSGGYTHANQIWVNEIVKDVKSKDITSSYPTVMISEKYPMSKFFTSGITSFNQMDKNRAYIMEVAFTEIYATTYNHYLPYSKGYNSYRVVADNGRVVSAAVITYILTDVDIEIISQCYKWSDVKILKCITARKDYLDKQYIEKILEFYTGKTAYKNVKGRENNYLQSKQYINSMYGMMVTNVIRDEVSYEGGEWSTIELTHDRANELLLKQVEKKNTFLSWAWGVYVTAYARKNLWTIILKLDPDVIYCDTDSVKYVGDYEDIFEVYNKEILHKLEVTLDHYKIDRSLIRPKSPDDIEHPLGIFDTERPYKEFKTLGAKKYCYKYDDGSIHITVSGVAKSGAAALKSLDDFRNGFIFDYDNSGKNLLTYNDDQIPVLVTDYQNNSVEYNDKYGLNLHPTTYELGIAADLQRYIDRTTHYSKGGF